MRKSQRRDFESFIWYDLVMFDSKKQVLPLLLFALSLSGCGGCSEKVVVPLLENVPADASLVVEMGDVDALIRGFGLYVEQVSRGDARPLVKRLRSALETQAGVQFFKPKTWTEAGVDVNAGLVFFIREDQKLLWMRATKPQIVELGLQKLLKRIDGATAKQESTHHGVTVTTLGRVFGAEVVPVLHYARTGNDYLLSLGTKPEALGQIINQREKRKADKTRWLDDTKMSQLSAKVQKSAIRWVGRSDLAAKLLGEQAKALSDGAAIGIDLGPTGLKVDGYVDFKLKGLENLLKPVNVLEQAKFVEEDGAVVLLTDAARPELFQILRNQPMFQKLLSSVQSRATSETGLDLENEALKHLSGPVAVALHLQDIKTLYSRITRGERRLPVLLDSLQVAVVAQIVDPKAMSALVGQSVKILTERGMNLRQREIKVGTKAATQFEPDKPSPRIGWGTAGNYYYYAAGTGRAEKVAKHLLSENPKSAFPALQSSVAASLAQEPGTQVAVLRTQVVAESLSLLLKQTNIPAVAKLGLTQQADMILALLGGLDDIALGLNVEPGHVVVKLRQSL